MTTPRIVRTVLLTAASASLVAACDAPQPQVHAGTQTSTSQSQHDEATPASTRFTFGSAVYDPDHHELLFLGWVQTASSDTEETWTWHDGSWHHLHPAHQPSPRSAVLMSDPATHQVFLQGGGYTAPPRNGVTGPGESRDDAWQWDGSDWHQLTGTGAPPVVSPITWAYVPQTQRLVVDFVGPELDMIGTYHWDGAHWTRDTRDEMPARSFAVDPGNGAVLAYRGAQARCFPDPCVQATSVTLFGDGLNWTQLSGTEPEPAAANLASDPLNGGVLLLNELGHTWVYGDLGWREAAISGPNPEVPGFLYSDGHGVYFQPQPDQSSPRWSWDGRSWHRAGS